VTPLSPSYLLDRSTAGGSLTHYYFAEQGLLEFKLGTDNNGQRQSSATSREGYLLSRVAHGDMRWIRAFYSGSGNVPRGGHDEAESVRGQRNVVRDQHSFCFACTCGVQAQSVFRRLRDIAVPPVSGVTEIFSISNLTVWRYYQSSSSSGPMSFPVQI
jgi:hypothetical protein